MSVKSSFFILSMLTFLVAIAMESLIWFQERQNTNVLAEKYAMETVQGFKQLLVLKSDPFKKQTLDYAAWNDLVHFTETKDPQWAQDNLDASIVQFGINGFYIVDQSKKVIFSESDKPFLEDITTVLNLKSFDHSKAELLHFFVKKDENVIEFYVAPIHRINEKVGKNSLAKGFVIIAKDWDSTFLKELNMYGIAEASLTKGEGSQGDYIIEHSLPITGLRGDKVATLYLHIHNRMGEALDRYGVKDMQLNIIHTILLMAIFALLIAKYISFPLRDITLALNQKSKEPLNSYLLKRNEYGAIATALCESFDNKAKLEDLNQNLERRINEEVESSRLKDRMLFQQAKLAALGEMLNNIAHQWKQPLNTISVVINKLFLENKTQKLTPELIESEIKKIRGLIHTMSETIDNFKDFFKPDKEKVEFSLRGAIEESIKITDGGIANGDIAFSVDCPENIMMNGFKKELSHVFLVLINNAKDAILQHHIAHGKISIKAYAQEHYNIIEFSDNGGGVDEAQLPHIFEPFFSTKEPTGGNGTGLYMSKQIVEQSMAGSITATNERGGLCVSMVLPKIED